MGKNEKRQIADIVEAFGKINEDIHQAFDAMSDLLINKRNGFPFSEWKKYTKGVNKPRNNYYDFEYFLNREGNWYYLNCYGGINGKAVGFTFVIAVEYDKVDDKDYLEFIEIFDDTINKRIPMLCIYGIYEPINKIENMQVIEDNKWNIVDEVLRLTDGWSNFDKIKKDLYYTSGIPKKWLDIQVNYKNNDGKILEGFENWYKSAKVKIIPIVDIKSEELAESIIYELSEEAKK